MPRLSQRTGYLGRNSQVQWMRTLQRKLGLAFLEEDLIDDQGSTGTGYLGRNSQVQWMRTLQRKLDHPRGESVEGPYAPPSG
jgi:hypothetical protein